MNKLILLGLLLSGASHAHNFQAHALPGDREKPQFVLGAATQRWTLGEVNWYYNPLNQPSNLSTAEIVKAIQTATARWSAMCNITFTYKGITASQPVMYGDATMVDSDNVFGWGALQANDSGFAAITRTWYSGTSYVDTDIMLNTAQSWTIDKVDALMTHELGHAIGLSHSDQATSIMYAAPYHTAQYMRTLRGDDAEGCAALYGAASTAKASRTFNWAEATYPEYLSSDPAPLVTAGDYYYRYYPGTKSYVSTRGGIAYYVDPHGAIQNMGPLESHFATARASGF